MNISKHMHRGSMFRLFWVIALCFAPYWITPVIENYQSFGDMAIDHLIETPGGNPEIHFVQVMK